MSSFSISVHLPMGGWRKWAELVASGQDSLDVPPPLVLQLLATSPCKKTSKWASAISESSITSLPMTAQSNAASNSVPSTSQSPPSPYPIQIFFSPSQSDPGQVPVISSKRVLTRDSNTTFASLAAAASTNFALPASDFRLQFEDCDVNPTDSISTLTDSNRLHLTVRNDFNSIKVQRQSASGENIGALLTALNMIDRSSQVTQLNTSFNARKKQLISRSSMPRAQERTIITGSRTTSNWCRLNTTHSSLTLSKLCMLASF